MRILYFLVPVGLLAAPFSAARAEDATMQRFTQSMSALYETAVLCEYALSPSPISYAQAIDNYIKMYYSNTDYIYWVKPAVNRRAKNADYCANRLQERLISYNIARSNFELAYEDYPSPPRLSVSTRQQVASRGNVQRSVTLTNPSNEKPTGSKF